MPVSTSKGGVHSRAPKHQNSFAFKHNKSSKKTTKILAKTHSNLCKRCHDQVEWRKKYRKYKPLKQPKKCFGCQQKNITRAYHILCNSCAGGRNVCAKCTKNKENPDNIQDDENIDSMGAVAKVSDVEHYLGGLKERERRGIIRKIEKGVLRIRKTDDGKIELFEAEPEEEESEMENEKESDVDDNHVDEDGNRMDVKGSSLESSESLTETNSYLAESLAESPKSAYSEKST
uniref:Uncharacterized protein n=1 Tax=Aplanochytrium stocchinoi TaxID=215587 RepID=A0A7S3PFY7_9STRA|mmetsp:Transcript_35131/g.43343  ORF Transcript_35131/g.43343 Transcript_35131/m.43343 type:complete len:232 (+) Transcript_35131:219-914(+)